MIKYLSNFRKQYRIDCTESMSRKITFLLNIVLRNKGFFIEKFSHTKTAMRRHFM